jgi:hypothetical protein
MIFSAIAGWFVRKFWPNGILIAVVIAAVNAVIQFFRAEAVNQNRALADLGANPNGIEIVLGGFAIDAVINVVAFAIVWGLRRKFKPHLESEIADVDATDEPVRND